MGWQGSMVLVLARCAQFACNSSISSIELYAAILSALAGGNSSAPNFPIVLLFVVAVVIAIAFTFPLQQSTLPSVPLQQSLLEADINSQHDGIERLDAFAELCFRHRPTTDATAPASLAALLKVRTPFCRCASSSSARDVALCVVYASVYVSDTI